MFVRRDPELTATAMLIILRDAMKDAYLKRKHRLEKAKQFRGIEDDSIPDKVVLWLCHDRDADPPISEIIYACLKLGVGLQFRGSSMPAERVRGPIPIPAGMRPPLEQLAIPPFYRHNYKHLPAVQRAAKNRQDRWEYNRKNSSIKEMRKAKTRVEKKLKEQLDKSKGTA